MGIAELKAGIVRRLLETNDKVPLNQVFRLLNDQRSDFYENLTDDQKSEIELGLRQIERGGTTNLVEYFKKETHLRGALGREDYSR